MVLTTVSGVDPQAVGECSSRLLWEVSNKLVAVREIVRHISIVMSCIAIHIIILNLTIFKASTMNRSILTRP
jgi:hypothetical protein